MEPVKRDKVARLISWFHSFDKGCLFIVEDAAKGSELSVEEIQEMLKDNKE